MCHMVAMEQNMIKWIYDGFHLCGKFYTGTMNVFTKEFVKPVWVNENYFEPP